MDNKYLPIIYQQPKSSRLSSGIIGSTAESKETEKYTSNWNYDEEDQNPQNNLSFLNPFNYFELKADVQSTCTSTITKYFIEAQSTSSSSASLSPAATLILSSTNIYSSNLCNDENEDNDDCCCFKMTSMEESIYIQDLNDEENQYMMMISIQKPGDESDEAVENICACTCCCCCPTSYKCNFCNYETTESGKPYVVNFYFKDGPANNNNNINNNIKLGSTCLTTGTGPRQESFHNHKKQLSHKYELKCWNGSILDIERTRNIFTGFDYIFKDTSTTGTILAEMSWKPCSSKSCSIELEIRLNSRLKGILICFMIMVDILNRRSGKK